MAAERKTGKRPGSVRWRPERGCYEARVRLPNGTRPSAYVSTTKDAWAWITRTLAQAEQGVYVVRDRRTTGDVLDEWIDDVAPKTLRPNSLYNYRRSLGYLRPRIGRVLLRDLQRQDIERAFTGLERDGWNGRPLARETLRLAHTVLKMALEYCVEVEYIARNPMARMKAPRPTPTSPRILTQEEVQAILDEAAGTRWHAPLMVMAATGMRVSEVLGLEWKNVDLDRGTVRIERQTGRVVGESGVRLVPVKTNASRRQVYLPPAVCDAVRWRRDVYRAEKRTAQDAGAWEEHGVVFCTEDGKLYYRSQLASQLERITRDLGLDDVTCHTFRHTVITVMQEYGQPIKAVQALVGHASQRTTAEIYSHATDRSSRALAVVMQDFLAPDDPGVGADLLTAHGGR